MKKTEFEKWFNKQFGDKMREYKKLNDDKLYNLYVDKLSELGKIKSELKKREIWDNELRAALYAKQFVESKQKTKETK